MIRALAIAMLLTGCCTAQMPKERLVVMKRAPVVQYVEKLADIEPALARPCDKPEPTENSAKAYADAMRARGDAIDACNARLARLREKLK